MPRNRMRKTKIGLHTQNEMQDAIDLAHQEGKLLTPVAGPSKDFKSPLDIRGLPKAGSIKNNRKPRRKGKSMIATDTSNKNEIEEREIAKNAKKKTEAVKKRTTVKRKVLQSDSNDEENDILIVHPEEEGLFKETENDFGIVDPECFGQLPTLPKEGNFVLVEFKTNNKKVFYAGKVLKDAANGETEISF